MQRLIDYLTKNCPQQGRVVVAMSGGVDSCLTAAAAYKAFDERSLGITVQSEFSLERDLEQAATVATAIGLEHVVLEQRLLDGKWARENGPDRCYHCKRAIFGKILKTYPGVVLLDGTNADDDPKRPGRAAAKELGVLSPLLEVGLEKSAVRSLAKEIGLPNWDAPSESCLATRIRTTAPITSEGLERVRLMETFFHELGVDTIRAYHDNLITTVVFLPECIDIIENNRDKFATLIQKIGLQSFKFEEFRE